MFYFMSLATGKLIASNAPLVVKVKCIDLINVLI